MAKRARSDRGLSSRVTPADQRDFIERARKRFQQAETAETNQRIRELDDLQFYAGEQWDPLVKQAREGQPANNNSNTGQSLSPVPARPSYVINKVREPVRQVLNQERQADLGVEIAAADDFGEGTPGISPEEIELREGLVRRIQRESQAADARSWAFQRAVIAGRGFYRVMTRYRPGKTNDQEIYVDRIYNQASVSLDPNHEQPDGSDAEWGFIGTDVPWDRYVADYGKLDDQPNALVSTSQSEWRALGDELPGWFTADGEQRSVRIVEYWYTDSVQRTLITLENGQTVYADEVPEGAPIALDENGDELTRDVIDRTIKWAKIDGVQVLEETEWAGKYIPIIKVVGEELQPFDSERRSEGMVRPSRDSQRGFNVMVSKWVEQIGLAPIPPWMGAAGFDEGFETEYALSNTRTLPALHFNTRDLEGTPIGPPTRTSITMEIQAIAGSVQLFDQAIKSTTQVPDITNLDPKINSDRQLKRVLSQSTQATSHYLDNLSRSIRYEGLVLNDLLYPVYSRKGRRVQTMTKQGETKAGIMHHPFTRHPQTKEPMPAGQMPQMQAGQPAPQIERWQLTPNATFNVTVKVTKNAETQRDAVEETLTGFVQADPQYALGLYGDLIWKYYDGPGREELEERGKLGLLPQVQQALQAKAQGGQAPNPEVQQLQQQVQQLTAALQTKTAEIQAKGQIEMAKDQADNATKLEIARIQQEGAFAVASLKAQLEAVNTAIEALQEERTAFHQAVQSAKDEHLAHASLVHEAAQNQLQRTHEVVQQAVDHANALQQGSQQHQQALEQGQQQQQNALEQGAQQHASALEQQAAQPTPEAGTNA